jgi:putative effector of murein hydrolase LrgA (UPF0299 family)
MKVKEEFAKWIMDIGKYVATAVLISSFLGDFSEKWILYMVGGSIVTLCLLGGFLIIKTLNKK